jgi:ADP-ribose pyrophosphatase YjhB (NUDIX family)
VPSPSDRAPAFDDAAAQRGGALPSDRRRVIRLAAYGVIRRGEAILLCRVSPGYPGTGLWTLPGGGLHFGEEPRAGAIREVEEETGLLGRITGEPLVLSNTGSWPRDPEVAFHQVRFIYPMEVVGGALRNELDESTDEAAWIESEALPTLPLADLVSLTLGLPVTDLP